jgi:tetratricopeptide (TPR) repeat protein
VRAIRERAILLRVLIPLLAAMVLNLAPQARGFSQNLLWARGALAEGRTRPAAAYLAAAARINPWRSDLWERAAQNALAAGLPDEAIDDLRRAKAYAPLSEDGRVTWGDALMAKGDRKGALLAWQDALTSYGPQADLYRRIAEAQRAALDFNSLRETLEAWNRLAPNDAQVLYQLGCVLAATEPAKALPPLMQALSLDSDLNASIRRLQEALNAGQVVGDPAYSFMAAGRALGSLEQWDLAAEAFRHSIMLKPDYGEAHAFLGEAEQHLGQDGLAELRRAQVLSPDSVLVMALQALYWERNGKAEQALVYLHAAADHEPDNPVWQAELGRTSADLGDMDAALGYYQRAAELAPDLPIYWRSLAGFSVTYNYQVRDVGLPAARQAVALAPDDPAALDLMGQILLVLNDPVSAERFLQRALAQDAQYAPAHLHLGIVFQQQNQVERALEEWNLARRLAPETAAGEQAARLLQRFSP